MKYFFIDSKCTDTVTRSIKTGEQNWKEAPTYTNPLRTQLSFSLPTATHKEMLMQVCSPLIRDKMVLGHCLYIISLPYAYPFYLTLFLFFWIALFFIIGAGVALKHLSFEQFS